MLILEVTEGSYTYSPWLLVCEAQLRSILCFILARPITQFSRDPAGVLRTPDKSSGLMPLRTCQISPRSAKRSIMRTGQGRVGRLSVGGFEGFLLSPSLSTKTLGESALFEHILHPFRELNAPFIFNLMLAFFFI